MFKILAAINIVALPLYALGEGSYKAAYGILVIIGLATFLGYMMAKEK